MGTILFLKVVIEDVVFHQGISGIWSFDMGERVVREKIGSGLVILSMSLLLRKGNPNNTTFSNHVEFGNFSTPPLVWFSYGYSMLFDFCFIACPLRSCHLFSVCRAIDLGCNKLRHVLCFLFFLKARNEVVILQHFIVSWVQV